MKGVLFRGVFPWGFSYRFSSTEGGNGELCIALGSYDSLYVLYIYVSSYCVYLDVCLPELQVPSGNDLESCVLLSAEAGATSTIPVSSPAVRTFFVIGLMAHWALKRGSGRFQMLPRVYTGLVEVVAASGSAVRQIFGTFPGILGDVDDTFCTDCTSIHICEMLAVVRSML